jgi:ABC-type Fe3+-siderophore transport system permease subunit
VIHPDERSFTCDTTGSLPLTIKFPSVLSGKLLRDHHFNQLVCLDLQLAFGPPVAKLWSRQTTLFKDFSLPQLYFATVCKALLLTITAHLQRLTNNNKKYFV